MAHSDRVVQIAHGNLIFLQFPDCFRKIDSQPFDIFVKFAERYFSVFVDIQISKLAFLAHCDSYETDGQAVLLSDEGIGEKGVFVEAGDVGVRGDLEVVLQFLD